MAELTNKQQAFVEYYLSCWNASEAARRAGYQSKANVIGSQLLANPSISARIRERLDELKMSANEVLTRLADHARGTMGDFIDPQSMSVDLNRAAKAGKLHLVKKVKYVVRTEEDVRTETVEFELYDAQSALVHLGKHHKLFTEGLDLTSGGKPFKTYIGVSPDDWPGGDSDS